MLYNYYDFNTKSQINTCTLYILNIQSTHRWTDAETEHTMYTWWTDAYDEHTKHTQITRYTCWTYKVNPAEQMYMLNIHTMYSQMSTCAWRSYKENINEQIHMPNVQSTRRWTDVHAERTKNIPNNRYKCRKCKVNTDEQTQILNKREHKCKQLNKTKLHWSAQVIYLI